MYICNFCEDFLLTNAVFENDLLADSARKLSIMLKTYLRFESKLNLGVINSNAGGLNFSSDGKHVFAPGLENIHVWSLKKGSLVITYCASTWRANCL